MRRESSDDGPCPDIGPALSSAGTAHIESRQTFRHGDNLRQGGRGDAMVEAARLFRKRSGGINVRLADSDALSVQGAFKVETYEKEGLTKLSLSIIADHVLALRFGIR
jgi:hypothetical protein